MSTEAAEKGSTLGGEPGEKLYSPEEEIVGKAMGEIFKKSPMKFEHEELPSLLKSIMSPCLTNLNEEMSKHHDLVLFHLSLYRNFCAFQVDKMNYVSLTKQVTPSQFPRLLHQNYSSTNEHFYVALLYHVVGSKHIDVLHCVPSLPEDEETEFCAMNGSVSSLVNFPKERFVSMNILYSCWHSC